jgi:general stress protein 26
VTTKAEPEPKAQLWELIGKFATAMLVTRADGGRMRARPLSLASAHDGGKLYFATNLGSPKVDEIEADAEVLVTLQDSVHYVSIAGTAVISRDRGLVARLWSEGWRIWFPEGQGDPSLAIVEVTPREAEYWDQGGARGISYALEMVKAYATGTTPESGASSANHKVQL